MRHLRNFDLCENHLNQEVLVDLEFLKAQSLIAEIAVTLTLTIAYGSICVGWLFKPLLSHLSS